MQKLLTYIDEAEEVKHGDGGYDIQVELVAEFGFCLRIKRNYRLSICIGRNMSGSTKLADFFVQMYYRLFRGRCAGSLLVNVIAGPLPMQDSFPVLLLRVKDHVRVRRAAVGERESLDKLSRKLQSCGSGSKRFCLRSKVGLCTGLPRRDCGETGEVRGKSRGPAAVHLTSTFTNALSYSNVMTTRLGT